MLAKMQVVFTIVLIALASALTGGLVLMTTSVALGTFLFAVAIMLSPFVGFGLVMAAYNLSLNATASHSVLERGIIALAKSLFAVAGTLILSSLLVAAGTPSGLIPSISLPTYLLGTSLGVGAVLLVNPAMRFNGLFGRKQRRV